MTASRSLSVAPRAATAPVKLSLRGVSKSFVSASGGRVEAIADIDLDVGVGEFVCLIGPSGCGKSTILESARRPSPAGRGRGARRRTSRSGPGPDRAVLFQDPALFPWLSVRGNVEFALKMRRPSPRDEVRERAEAWLAKVHLTRFADAQPHELSGGCAQRAALARALACRPDVLLADEPFGALDAQSREILQKELQLVWTELGNTFVFVTHNVREAAFLADRVIVLSARPGTPIEEYRITTPRPRSFEDVLLSNVVVDIHDNMAKEVERAAREDGSSTRSGLGSRSSALSCSCGGRSTRRRSSSTQDLPSPADVWTALTSNLTGDDGLLAAARGSIIRLAFGLGVSVVVGTLIGFAMAASRVVQRSVGTLMTALQALPAIAWLPLAIVWLGFTERAVMFVVVVAGDPGGRDRHGRLRSARCRRCLIRAGRTMGASGWTLYRSVVLPAAVPGYWTGLQQAWAVAWRALLAAELIRTGAARGLGHALDASTRRTSRSLILAAMVVIVIIGLAVDSLFAAVDRRIRHRRGMLIPA